MKDGLKIIQAEHKRSITTENDGDTSETEVSNIQNGRRSGSQKVTKKLRIAQKS